MELNIQEYKGVRTQKMNLEKKHTIIFGENGSGKSSLAYVLAHEVSDFHKTYSDSYEIKQVQQSEAIKKNLVIYLDPYRMIPEIDDINDYPFGIEWSISELAHMDDKIKEDLASTDNLRASVVKVFKKKNNGFSGLTKFMKDLFMDCSLKKIEDFNNLSDGQKNIAMVYIYLRLNSIILEEFQHTGAKVIVIDEFDLNIHESLIMKFYNKITNQFPEWKFIITTHSPALLSNVNNDEVDIYKIDCGSLEKVENLFELSIDQVLMEHFNVNPQNQIIADFIIKSKKSVINFWNEYNEEATTDKVKELVEPLIELERDQNFKMITKNNEIKSYKELISEIKGVVGRDVWDK